MTAPRDFRGAIIDQHLDRIFQEVIEGKAAVTAEVLEQLARYQHEAERLEDVYVQGRVHGVRGTLLLTRFRLAEAEDNYRQALRLYTQAGSERVIGMESNLALLCLQRGNYQDAAAMFSALLNSMPPNVPRRSDVSLNAALALLPLFRWQDALDVLLPTLEDYGEKIVMLRAHVHDGIFIMEQRAALGMAQMGTGHISASIDSARLAVDFTRQIHMPYARGLAFSLMLRLAADGHVTDDADALCAHLDAIAQPPADLYIFCLLRDEGRYYAWHDNPALAQWFIERTRAIADAHASQELHASIDAALTL
jgi:tetratricopeptide (TPR) repeat protein